MCISIYSLHIILILWSDIAVSWVGALKVSHSAIHVGALPRAWHAECSSELLDNYWTGISTVCSSPETVHVKVSEEICTNIFHMSEWDSGRLKRNSIKLAIEAIVKKVKN